MQIAPINNVDRQNKPNFKAIIGAEALTNSALQSFVNNPDFQTLAENLAYKGKDLLIKKDKNSTSHSEKIYLYESIKTKPTRLITSLKKEWIITPANIYCVDEIEKFRLSKLQEAEEFESKRKKELDEKTEKLLYKINKRNEILSKISNEPEDYEEYCCPI